MAEISCRTLREHDPCSSNRGLRNRPFVDLHHARAGVGNLRPAGLVGYGGLAVLLQHRAQRLSRSVVAIRACTRRPPLCVSFRERRIYSSPSCRRAGTRWLPNSRCSRRAAHGLDSFARSRRRSRRSGRPFVTNNAAGLEWVEPAIDVDARLSQILGLTIPDQRDALMTLILTVNGRESVWLLPADRRLSSVTWMGNGRQHRS